MGFGNDDGMRVGMGTSVPGCGTGTAYFTAPRFANDEQDKT